MYILNYKMKKSGNTEERGGRYPWIEKRQK